MSVATELPPPTQQAIEVMRANQAELKTAWETAKAQGAKDFATKHALPVGLTLLLAPLAAAGRLPMTSMTPSATAAAPVPSETSAGAPTPP